MGNAFNNNASASQNHDVHRRSWADLACSSPNVDNRSPIAPENQPAVRVPENIRVGFVLQRNAIQVITVEKKRINISFRFDALLDGILAVYICAKEEDNIEPIATETICKGNGQLFPSRTFEVDLSAYPNTQLLWHRHSQCIPLLIRFSNEQHNSNAATSSGQRFADSVSMSFTFKEEETGNIGVAYLRQSIIVGKQRYVVRDVYTAGNADNDDRVEAHIDLPGTCVVCLSSLATTTIIPCLHMCVCAPCATELRRRTSTCPICRHAVEEFWLLS